MAEKKVKVHLDKQMNRNQRKKGNHSDTRLPFVSFNGSQKVRAVPAEQSQLTFVCSQ